MVHPDLQKFCTQWFIVQSVAMNSMFRLLGELSHQQNLALKTKNDLLYTTVTNMRIGIVGTVMDETNLTKRTGGYGQLFHNELFKQSAEKAGVMFPTVDKITVDTEINDFLLTVTEISDFENLFAFLRATEHEAEDIFKKIRALFEKHNAPKNAFVYIEVHEKIESLHNEESRLVQEELLIDESLVNKYITLWRKTLEHLKLLE